MLGSQLQKRQSTYRFENEAFAFPRNVKRCREWLKSIGEPCLAKCTWSNLTQNKYVCRDHFLEHHITLSQRAAQNEIPVIFTESRPPLLEADLINFDASVPIERKCSEPCVEADTTSVAQDPATGRAVCDNDNLVEWSEVDNGAGTANVSSVSSTVPVAEETFASAFATPVLDPFFKPVEETPSFIWEAIIKRQKQLQRWVYNHQKDLQPLFE